MKKLLFLYAMLLCSLSAYSNTNSSDSAAPQDSLSNFQPELYKAPITDAYKNTPEWGKYLTLRAVGWSCLGVGVAAGVTGPFIMILLGELNGHDKAWPGAVVWGTGIALTAASIPMLAVAYHTRSAIKKRYLNMGLTSIKVPTYTGMTEFAPGINFSISF